MLGRIVVALSAFLAIGFGTGSAVAKDWLLNPTLSRFYMQTAKANAIIETHQFGGLEGTVGSSGDATVRIDLLSVKSGIDIRDVRMRFLLFQTYKFPFAEVNAKLDMGRFQELLKTARVPYDLAFKVDLHGVVQELTAPVFVTRLSDTSISVASAKPIIVKADMFGLLPGIAKLSEAVNGTPIVTAASITFDLVFETGDKLPQIEAVRAEVVNRRTQEETSAISADKCETRFSVISAASAVYFRSGSAFLDPASDAILDSVADIANRCPSVNFQVSGHTDNVGGKGRNKQLSELRARSVVAYLVGKGVKTDRIRALGFGDEKPVSANDNDANRARNRRIEFSVTRP